MSHTPQIEAWIRYHQAEGFRVGLCECRECEHFWYDVAHPEECVAWKLECPNCHAKNNRFNELSENRK